MVLSLRWRFLGWFFVNLLLIALAVVGFLRVQFRFGINSLLAGPTGDRLEAIARPLGAELRRLPESQWTGALDRAVAPWRAQGVRASLFRNDATPVAGDFQTLPAEVRLALGAHDRPHGPGHRPPPPGPPPSLGRGGGGLLMGAPPSQPPVRGDPGPPPFEPPPEPADAPAAAARGEQAANGEAGSPTGTPSPAPGLEKFLLAAGSPRLYWAGVHLDGERLDPSGPPGPLSGPPPPPMTLLLVSDSLRGAGLFFDYTPWLGLGSALGLLSVALWLPFIGRLTRALGGMTQTAERIAEGQFDAPTVSSRRDELGRLSRALGHMSARLEGFVTGQKRFLGDTAHELLSPLGRLEVSLSILEQRAAPNDRALTDRALGEVRHLAGLVGDLLLFTKSELRAAPITLGCVPLLELARSVVSREGAGADVRLVIPPDLAALADADLLGRALANAVRNAVRYAGAAGPITVSAVPAPDAPGEALLLTVADQEPGAPADALHRLFDPFFRPEAARTRETGGTGLGLAIVKSCVEACGGQVTARNRTVKGLALVFRLPRAPSARLDA